MVQGWISTQCFEKQIVDFFLNVEPQCLQYKIDILDDVIKKLYWICESQVILNVIHKKKYFWSLRSKTSASTLMTAPIAGILSIFTKPEYGY